jgi:hypothetical protein
MIPGKSEEEIIKLLNFVVVGTNSNPLYFQFATDLNGENKNYFISNSIKNGLKK